MQAAGGRRRTGPSPSAAARGTPPSPACWSARAPGRDGGQQTLVGALDGFVRRRGSVDAGGHGYGTVGVRGLFSIILESTASNQETSVSPNATACLAPVGSSEPRVRKRRRIGWLSGGSRCFADSPSLSPAQSPPWRCAGHHHIVDLSGQPVPVQPGLLRNGGDLRFALWDAQQNGGVVAGPLTASGVNVVRGQFAVNLDFGQAAWNGNQRWLAIEVRNPATTGAWQCSRRGS